MSVINLSDLEATEKFRQLNHKSILYFTAVWCKKKEPISLSSCRRRSTFCFTLPPPGPPCKAIKPVYEELAGKYSDVAFGKVDVDENADAAIEFEISAVPTFVLFDGEDAVQRFSGADPNKLESLIKDLDSQ